MSVHTYFCYCCLSDSNLISLFNTTDVNGEEECYADILASSFGIKISKSDFEDFDVYICDGCSIGLKNTMKLKNSVMQTLNILEINKVIETKKSDNFICVTKVQTGNIKPENATEFLLDDKDTVTYDSDSEMNLQVEFLEEFEEVEYLDLPEEEIVPDELNFEDEIDEEIAPEQGSVQKEAKTRKRKKPSATKKKGTVKAEKKGPTVEELPYEVTEDLKCPMCKETNEKFASEKSYHMHMNKHFPNYVCPTCGCTFVTKIRLWRHIPIHERGVYPCTKCDIVCISKERLRSHNKRKHSELKRNKCTICSERFDSYHQRTMHLVNVHGFTERTHSCKYCPKTFLRSASLYSHVQENHAQRPFICLFCGAGFTRKQRFEAHMSNHANDEQKYIMCSLCPKIFLSEIAVRGHMQLKHAPLQFSPPN